MNNFPRSLFRNSVRIIFALITLILLSTCMEVIDENLMLLVADKFAPVLKIDFPQFGTSYVSEMAIVGTIIDSSEEEEDGKGLLASLTLEFLDSGAFNRTVLFDKDGNVASMIPDDDFFTFVDRATGKFILNFDTVKSNGKAHDRHTEDDEHGLCQPGDAFRIGQGDPPFPSVFLDPAAPGG